MIKYQFVYQTTTTTTKTIKNAQYVILEIYDAHTHYYNKLKIVTPTRRFLHGELKQEAYPMDRLTINSCCAV